MNRAQLLATAYALRTNAQYQGAEHRRRSKNDVAAMANADKMDPDYGAVSLLINTWEAISALALDCEDEDKDFIFGVLPALHMFTELNDAIETISRKHPGYAANFRLLSKQQQEWLKFKDDHYQTGEKAGMHALFG